MRPIFARPDDGDDDFAVIAPDSLGVEDLQRIFGGGDATEAGRALESEEGADG
jgi:hypothetical protein